jgi:hypothetical protein
MAKYFRAFRPSTDYVLRAESEMSKKSIRLSDLHAFSNVFANIKSEESSVHLCNKLLAVCLTHAMEKR